MAKLKIQIPDPVFFNFQVKVLKLGFSTAPDNRCMLYLKIRFNSTTHSIQQKTTQELNTWQNQIHGLACPGLALKLPAIDSIER